MKILSRNLIELVGSQLLDVSCIAALILCLSRYRRCTKVNIIPSKTANIYSVGIHLASLLLIAFGHCVYKLLRTYGKLL